MLPRSNDRRQQSGSGRVDEYGQITVFLSLLFLLLMSTCFIMIEGVREYMTGALCQDALEGAGQNILANYDRPLFDRYHLFFLDPREKRQIRQDGVDYLNQYCDNSSFFAFSCRSLSVKGLDNAMGQDGKILKHEIREWMKYRPSGASEYLDRIREMYDVYSRAGSRSSSYVSELIHAGDHDSDLASGSDHEGDGQEEASVSQEAIVWKSIKETLDIYADSDLLSICLPSGKPISHLKADLSDLPSAGRQGLGSGQGIDRIPSGSFEKVDAIASLFPGEDTVGPDETVFDKESYLLEYINDRFYSYDSGYSDDSNPSDRAACLKYEMEYMINGNDSDMENLRRMAARIFFLRFMVNYAYARNDDNLWREAARISLQAGGQNGLPSDPRAGQLMLVGAAAYGQTLVDMRKLLAGGKAALVPSAGDWLVNYENYREILCDSNIGDRTSQGVSYSDYLRYFIASDSMSRIRCQRMMDIMQMNVRLSEKSFRMKDCLFSFAWEADIKSAKWFPSIPGLDLVSDSMMLFKIKKINSY